MNISTYRIMMYKSYKQHVYLLGWKHVQPNSSRRDLKLQKDYGREKMDIKKNL